MTISATARPIGSKHRVRVNELLAITVSALISLALSAMPSIMGHVPRPAVHDEFAYLLQADTFARGRLTNPPHELWEHFETFHVIQQPTYAGKFPPALGMALAVGKLLGHPIIGAWLSTALGCAATTWMMLAFVPARWALLGGILIATAPTVHWWSQGYWGGGMAMTGGALLGGAAGRIVKRPGPLLGVVVAVALAILANSRPFEGLILSVIVAALASAALLKSDRLLVTARSVLPAAILTLLPFLGLMAFYNWRVTGVAWRLPYVLHQTQYMAAPLMWWQQPRPAPDYRHDVMRRFHLVDEWDEYARQTTPAGFLTAAFEKVQMLIAGYLQGWALPLPLAVGALMIGRSRGARWMVIVCIALPLIQIACTPWLRNHYLAPAIGFVYTLAAIGLRRIGLARIHRVGTALVLCVVVVHICAGVSFSMGYAQSKKPPQGNLRQSILEQFEQSDQGAKHLVIIHHGPTFSPVLDIMFNDADIDASPIVFARDAGDAKNTELLRYFRDRRAWRLDIDIPRLVPLDFASGQPSNGN
ncbi:MAG: hypothetical protein ACREJC_02620 [Tepidisphaeraceae bacterium]